MGEGKFDAQLCVRCAGPYRESEAVLAGVGSEQMQNQGRYWGRRVFIAPPGN